MQYVLSRQWIPKWQNVWISLSSPWSLTRLWFLVDTLPFWENSQKSFNQMATFKNYRKIKCMQNICREVARYFKLMFLFFSLKNPHHQEQGLKTTTLENFPTIAEKHQFSISMLAMKLLSKPYQVWLRVCMIWQDMFNPKLKWHQCMEKYSKIVLIASHNWNKENITFYEWHEFIYYYVWLPSTLSSQSVPNLVKGCIGKIVLTISPVKLES